MTIDDSPLDANEIYDSIYYAWNLGIPYERNDHWLNFFGEVADRLVADLAPKTVLDVGCAFGFLVEALIDRHVDARGIDISEYAISQVGGSAVGHCEVGSALDPFSGRYDLVTTVEMIEHLDADAGRKALENMASVTDRILLSTTPFDYAEASHVNVQPAEYWADLMASVGFYRDLSYDAGYLTDWATLYVRREPTSRELVIDYERAETRLRIERNELRREVLRLDSVMGELRREVEANREEEFQELHAEFDKERAQLKEQIWTARDAASIAEAERGTALTTVRLLQERVAEAGSYGSQAVAADANAAIERLAAIEQSTTWRLMWKLLTPYRWLQGRR